MIEDIQYVVAGRAFAGVLATPSATPRGGIAVFHGGSGLGAHDRAQCTRLAEASATSRSRRICSASHFAIARTASR